MLFAWENSFERINKVIQGFYKEVEDEKEVYNSDRSSCHSYNKIFNSQNRGDVGQQLLDSIQTTKYALNDYYSVTNHLIARQNPNKILNLNKSVAFSFGKNKYVVISDISGVILFLDLFKKNIEVIRTQKSNSGPCTALEFSKNLDFLYSGYCNGNLSVFEVSSFTELKILENLFSKPITQILCYSEEHLLVTDSTEVIRSIHHSKSYFIYNTFESQQINLFENREIKTVDIAEIYTAEEDLTTSLGLFCFENELVLISLFPTKNIQCKFHSEYSYSNSSFNRKIYSEKKRLFFSAALQN